MGPRKDDRSSKTRIRFNMMNNPLVSITDNALKRAKDLLSENKSIVGLRVSVSQGGCSGMTYEVSLSEKINKGDEVVKKNGITFIIDPSAVMFFNGISNPLAFRKSYIAF